MWYPVSGANPIQYLACRWTGRQSALEETGWPLRFIQFMNSRNITALTETLTIENAVTSTGVRRELNGPVSASLIVLGVSHELFPNSLLGILQTARYDLSRGDRVPSAVN